MLGNAFMPFREKIFGEMKHPIDFEIKVRERRLFGENKTFEGLVMAMLFALFVGLIQYLIRDVPFFKTHSIIDYSTSAIFWIAPVQGFAAVLGDALKSSLKRQVGVKPGKPFLFVDQTDFVFTNILFSYFLYPVDPVYYLAILIIYPLLHIVSNIIGYLIGVKEEWI